MLRVISTPFSLQKAGNAPAEYEDAYYPTTCGEQTGTHLRFAIADGATEGMLSGKWAQLLTQAFKRQWKGREHAQAWLDRAYRDWARLKTEYIRQRQAQNRPIQWYEEPGLEAGAFSTLLGLTFTRLGPGRAGSFEAVALGDSCLFQIRHDVLMLRFPFSRPEEFGSRPLLLASNPARNRRVLENLKRVRGRFRTGDRFYMLTDALAAWFMKEFESGNAPWTSLEKLDSDKPEQTFAAWIETLRQTQQLRNDDVTCIRLEIV